MKTDDVSAGSLGQRVRAFALEAGYADCGFTGVELFETYRKELETRIARFPETRGFYESMLKRVNPVACAPWAKSIVVCVRWYGKYAVPANGAGHFGKNYLCDSRNAACPDHALSQKMTAFLKEQGWKVRRGGVPDREAAVRAGVVEIGRNGFAYSRKHGSWINIETWLVDAELPPGNPSASCPCPDGCRACMDACPTSAIVEPFVMLGDRCVAYLTYFAPEPVAPDLWKKMGCWIYGCDVCQDVCPLNRGKWQPNEPMPWLEKAEPFLAPERLAAMDAETYRTVIHPLFRYIPEENLARWRANAKRAMLFSR